MQRCDAMRGIGEWEIVLLMLLSGCLCESDRSHPSQNENAMCCQAPPLRETDGTLHE
jgi:hypothetical protein